jgi:hypothetical protein
VTCRCRGFPPTSEPRRGRRPADRDRGRRCRLRPLLALLPLAVAACGSPASRPPPPAAAQPAPPPAEVDAAAGSGRIDRLCHSLARIVRAEIRAFADLRGPPVDARSWQGREVPPPMRSCTVEGDYYPGAQYVCRGERSWPGRPDGLEPAFAALARDLDACLGRPGWGQRGWTRGRTFTFAAGERQILWRYGGNIQRPGLSLKIEEDIGRNIWLIRLAVMTLR